MKLAFLSAIGCLLGSTLVASAQEKKPLLAQDALVGKWANVSKKGDPGFVISRKGDAWSIEPFDNKGIGTGAKATLWLLADNSGDGKLQPKSRPYGFATWNLDNGALHWTLRLEKDELVVETFLILQKDKSLGPNLRAQGKFKKK